MTNMINDLMMRHLSHGTAFTSVLVCNIAMTTRQVSFKKLMKF
jgi:hypothetical protein